MKYQKLDFLFQVNGYKLLAQKELEEHKAEETYERLLVFTSFRKSFFRKMLRFLDKYLLPASQSQDSALISQQVANSNL